jgi:divalent metal cation (Fe/Co/Zn/Cd) transporter
MSVELGRAALIRSALRLEVFTVVWMVVEAAVAIAAGVVAGSVLLTAFGLDSFVELVSGGVLLWRLSVEAGTGDLERVERVERRATWFVAVTLLLLCLYVVTFASVGLATQSKPDTSVPGIVISIAAVIVMPYLAFSKRRLAERIDSSALRGDAAESLTCGYMAATVLVGVASSAAFGWWWADDIAGLVFLVWLAREAKEALEDALETDESDESEGGGD